jgi:hypothetical protein
LNDGAGALLSQGEVDEDLHIVFANCCVNKAEKNCSTVKNEVTAVVWGIKHFWTYLYGRKFKVMSDHKPLTSIMNVKDLGPRLLRWHIQLEEYDCEFTNLERKTPMRMRCLGSVHLQKKAVNLMS